MRERLGYFCIRGFAGDGFPLGRQIEFFGTLRGDFHGSRLFNDRLGT